MSANMSIWSVDFDIGGSLDRALGSGGAHEETFIMVFESGPARGERYCQNAANKYRQSVGKQIVPKRWKQNISAE